MTEWRFLKGAERKEIEKALEIEFGINEIPGEIIMSGSEKLFFFSGELGEEDVARMAELAPVERIGVYFAKAIAGEIRLSIEGSQILKNQIKKNIFELDEKQAESWMLGDELNVVSGMKGFVVMKYKDNFMGCGKASLEKIGNFIPKTRRLKRKSDSSI